MKKELEKYINERIAYLTNPVNYQYGFVSKAERDYKVEELERLKRTIACL